MSIEDHEFFDDDLDYCHSSSSEIYLNVGCETPTVMCNKEDVIALAKHFNLTAEDLTKE